MNVKSPLVNAAKAAGVAAALAAVLATPAGNAEAGGHGYTRHGEVYDDARVLSVEETTEYARPARRCETTYRSHQEERVDSYRVIYEYDGRKYATDTSHDRGDRIRVDVRPAP